MTSFIVTYMVAGKGLREYRAGPYDSYWVAEEHRRDIAGYEGVHSSCVVLDTQFTRKDSGDT